MSIQYKFTCNLCGDALDKDTGNGIALRWAGNDLEPADTWSGSQTHLCHGCIATVAKLQVQAEGNT